MDGVPKIGPGLGTPRTAPVDRRTKREQESAEDFAETLEQHGPPTPPLPDSPAPPPVDLDLGYPTDDETGLSLDVKA